MRPILKLLDSGMLRASFVAVSLGKSAAKRTFSNTSAVFSSERLYTKDHEWISVENKIGTVGISSFAQEAIGDVVYVELPQIGQKLSRGDTVGAVESVKAASDIYSPVSGTVVEANADLETKPFLINKSTYKDGWLYKLELEKEEELKSLMDENTYENFCKEKQNEEE